MITTDSVSVMGSWLQEAINRIRAVSARAPVHLAHASDGWSLQVYAHVPVGKAQEPTFRAEVGMLVPIESSGGGLGLARAIAPGQAVSLPAGPITLTCAGDDLIVDGMRIPTTSALLHPAAPIDDPQGETMWDVGTIDRVAASLTGVASRNDMRLDLCAVHLLPGAPGVAVATDSYSLRQLTLPMSVPEPLDVSRPFFDRVAREIRRERREEPIRIARHAEHTVAWLGDDLYVASAPCRPLGLAVPSLFPVWTDEAVLSRTALIDAVQAAAGESDDPITIRGTGEGIALARPDEDTAVVVDGAGAAGIPETGLNPIFLLANLRATDVSQVTLRTTGDPLRPIGIYGEGIEMLQMPVRL